MKTLIVLIFTIISSQVVRADNTRGSFYFNYISNDGEVYLDCTHSKLDSEPEFYRVSCGKGTNFFKTFDARFRVRPLGSPTKPSYEIVFWVTDRNKPERWDEGSTTWITLTKGAITDVALHQEVENSYAALVIHYSAGL
jgi:hypothetical protein